MGETFGNRLKTCRLRSGKSVVEICAILHVTTGAYYKYENETSCPDTKTVISLCKILGCDPNCLYGFDNDSHRWGHLAVKAGQFVNNFPEPKQRLALFILHAIRLEIISKELATYSLDSDNFNL